MQRFIFMTLRHALLLLRLLVVQAVAVAVPCRLVFCYANDLKVRQQFGEGAQTQGELLLAVTVLLVAIRLLAVFL